MASLLSAPSPGAASAGSSEGALRSCLSRLLVVHCCSSSQLVLTLHLLETSLLSRPGLALLLIDSISAFFWLDRSEGGGSSTKQEEKLSKCSLLLARLLRYVLRWFSRTFGWFLGELSWSWYVELGQVQNNPCSHYSALHASHDDGKQSYITN